jgi:hypothetical protein
MHIDGGTIFLVGYPIAVFVCWRVFGFPWNPRHRREP